MSSNSPDVIIFDGYGNPLAVQNNTATPTNTSAILVAGSDGTYSHYLSLDSSGRQIFVGAGTAGTNSGGVLTVQGNASGVSLPVSPSSPLDVSASVSLSSLGANITIDTQGASTLLIYVSGTWVGTIIPQISLDGGATYPGQLSIFPGIGSGSFIVAPSGITANGFYYVSCGSSRLIRIYMSAYTSGTAVIQTNASAGEQYVRNLSFVTDGTNFAAIASGNSSPTAAQNSLVVALSPNLPGGALPVALFPSGAQDSLGNAVTVSRVTQITTKFYQQAPSMFMNVTTTGGATATQGTTGVNIGCAVFSTGTATTAEVIGTTFATVAYATQYEAWATQSVKFTTPTSAASYQRIGIYNTLDGFSWGYSGTTFGLWTRFNGTDTFIAQTAWNKDILSGAAGSLFTSAGSPVALVPTYFNKYRIRYGWYGSITTSFEVYAPDGIWVLVHQARFANSQTTVNLTNPDLPLTVDISKTSSDATNLTIASGAWSAGVTAPPTGPIVTGTQTISANGAYTIIPVLTQQSLSFTISGTWVGTIAFNYSLDGVNFTSDDVLNQSLGTFVTSTTVNNAFTANVASFKYYQIVATAWTSGTATITYSGSSAVSLVTSMSLITDSANHGPAAVKAASTAAATTDAALVVALSPNTTPTNAVNGIQALQIQNAENERATYSIGLAAFASATTNQDVFCLIGSSTKVVRLTRIRFSMTVTTAVIIPVQLFKRSTLNTGGTSGVAAITPHDSNNAAATATNIAYITNQATNGTIVGTMIRSDKYFAEVATPTSECQIIDWVFGQNGSQAPTLRNNTSELCINLGGVTIAGGSVSISIEWTEDSN